MVARQGDRALWFLPKYPRPCRPSPAGLWSYLRNSCRGETCSQWVRSGLPGPVQAEVLPSSRSRESAWGHVWGPASRMMLTGVRYPCATPADITRRVLSDTCPVLYLELNSCPQLVAGRKEGCQP